VARKQSSKQNARSEWGKRLAGFRWRAVVVLAVVALLGWGGQALWRSVAPMVIHRDIYLVPAEGFSISQTPEWITADVCAEVVRNSGIDRRLSVLEEDFKRAVQDAFALHPWVESVDSIDPNYPPAVHVEVTYRRPVAAVELASSSGVVLYPVDRHAIRLPEGDVPEIRKRYLPRIGGIVERPPLGQRWEDSRVLGATVLAEKLSDRWEALSLVDILPSSRPEIHAEHRYFIYDLITRGGTRILGSRTQSSAAGRRSFCSQVASPAKLRPTVWPARHGARPGGYRRTARAEDHPTLGKKNRARQRAGGCEIRADRMLYIHTRSNTHHPAIMTISIDPVRSTSRR